VSYIPSPSPQGGKKGRKKRKRGKEKANSAVFHFNLPPRKIEEEEGGGIKEGRRRRARVFFCGHFFLSIGEKRGRRRERKQLEMTAKCRSPLTARVPLLNHAAIGKEEKEGGCRRGQRR